MKGIPETTTFYMPRAELSAGLEMEMYDLLSRHFEGVTREQFRKDLDEKNRVIFLQRGGRLVGFSTLAVYETTHEGEPVSVVCSGDTIVAPEAWNSTALSRTWIACVNELRRRYPRGKYVWLFLTSGFRTYRFLPVFWREFYPRFDAPMPADRKRLLDFLAAERYGTQYDAASGIVRFTRPQRLRDALGGIPPGKNGDAHVAFFLERNPCHAAGDELVCLTDLTDENLTPAGRRMAGARTHEACPC